MQQPVIEERAGVLPIADHLHRERAVFSAGRCDATGVLHGLHDIVFEEPLARLSKLGFAAQIVYLQVKLCLFVRGFRGHPSFSSFIFIFCPAESTALQIHKSRRASPRETGATRSAKALFSSRARGRSSGWEQNPPIRIAA